MTKDQLPRIPPKHLKDGCYARADAIEMHLEAAKAENEQLRAELETVTAARDRWHRKYEGACATIDTYSSDEPFVQPPQRYKVQQDKGEYCLKGCTDGDLVDYSAYEALLRRLNQPPSQKSGESLPPCKCLLLDKEPSAYHALKCPRYVADAL